MLRTTLALVCLMLASPFADAGQYLAGIVAAAEATRPSGPKPPAPDPSEICPDCNGTGKLGDGTIFVVCPSCNGTGKRATTMLAERWPITTTNSAQPTGIQWMTWAEAVANAAGSGKDTLVYISGATCENCRILEKTSFRDPKVIALMNQYQLVQVDGDQYGAAWGVRSWPTFVLVSPEWRVKNKASAADTASLVALLTGQ